MRQHGEYHYRGFRSGSIALALAFLALGPMEAAVARECSSNFTITEQSELVQELMKESLALEARNPAKAKELDPKLRKIMDEDGQAPNDENPAKLCADYQMMLQLVRSAQ